MAVNHYAYHDQEKGENFGRPGKSRGSNHRAIAMFIIGLAVIALLVAVADLVGGGYLPLSANTGDGENGRVYEEDWNLLLVNAENAVPDGYDLELTLLDNGEAVDSRIYPALQAMFDDARAAGVYPVVTSGYRTAEEQQRLREDKIAWYIGQGCSQKEAEEDAKMVVAAAGYSEHQLGSAVDINADKTKCHNEQVYAWLLAHGADYGFVLRYPQEKAEVTGILYEPWHYRYVGKEAAAAMTNQGLCLEEYLRTE